MLPNCHRARCSGFGDDVISYRREQSAVQIGSPEVRVTEMRGQSWALGRFDSRIDSSSLATLADLGLSEVQIARYRRRWCGRQPPTGADAALKTMRAAL